MKSKSLFIDTNILLHYQLFEDIIKLKLQIPELKLSFNKGYKHTVFSLVKPNADLSCDENEIEYQLEQVRLKYPKKSLPGSGGVRGLGLQISIPPEFSFSPEDITRYNAEIAIFYKNYEHYLIDSLSYENRKRRTIELIITLANEGTCPAEDVSIFLDFPEQLQLYNKDRLLGIPSPPKPPQEPKTIYEKLNSSSLNLNSVAIQPGLFNRSMYPNVSLLRIQGWNGDAVEFHVRKIKQRVNEFLEPLYVVFDSYEGASSFRINYRINAANVANEVIGHLDVVIKKESDSD